MKKDQHRAKAGMRSWYTRNMPTALHDRLRRIAFESRRPVDRVAIEAIELGLTRMEKELA